MWVYVNNQFVDDKNAFIGISDLSIQRGFGIFDFFRTSNNIPLFLEDYLDRFFHSAEQLKLQPTHTKEEIRAIVFELIKKNQIVTSGFKLILTGGYSPDGFEPGSPNFIVTQQPVEITSEEKFEQGIQITLYEYLRDLPEVKSINYLMALYLKSKQVGLQVDDTLYCKEEKVLEFPRSNVFIVTNNNEVVTPKRNVLHGITRKRVLEIAQENFIAEEREITISELNNAAEVFLTSTTKRIIPVLKIDDKVVGDGKPGVVTRSLYRSFRLMEDKYCESYKISN